jgi:hypothetical protein
VEIPLNAAAIDKHWKQRDTSGALVRDFRRDGSGPGKRRQVWGRVLGAEGGKGSGD